MGLSYDTFARRRWSEYSYNGVVDNDLVSEAEGTLDRSTKTSSGQSHSHGGHQLHSCGGEKRNLPWNKGYQDDTRRK